MTFRARFWLGVVARGGRGLFSRDRISPFVPSVGMRVSFDDPSGKWEIHRVSRVRGSRTWSCHLGDFEEPTRNWEEIREDYLRSGWVLLREWAEPVQTFWLRNCRGVG